MKLLKKCSIIGMAVCFSITLYACGSSGQNVSAEVASSNNASSSASISRLSTSLNGVMSASDRLTQNANGTSLSYSLNNQNQNYNSSNATNSSNTNSNNSSTLNSTNNTSSNALNSSNNVVRYNPTSNSSSTNGANSTNSLLINSMSNSQITRTNLLNQIQALKTNAEELKTMLSTNQSNSQLANVEDCCKVLDLTSSSINTYAANNQNLNNTTNTNANTSNYNFTLANRTTTNQTANNLNSSNQSNQTSSCPLCDRLIYNNVQISNEAINNLKSSINGNGNNNLNINYALNANTTNTNNNLTNQSTSTMSSRRLTQSNPNFRNPAMNGNYVDQMNTNTNPERSSVRYSSNSYVG